MLRTALVLVAVLAACAAPADKEVFAGTAGAPFSSMVRVGNTYYVAGHLGRTADGVIPADPAAEAALEAMAARAVTDRVDAVEELPKVVVLVRRKDA